MHTAAHMYVFINYFKTLKYEHTNQTPALAFGYYGYHAKAPRDIYGPILFHSVNLSLDLEYVWFF